jgi:excinuclease UvrABC ATPase subunit
MFMDYEYRMNAIMKRRVELENEYAKMGVERENLSEVARRLAKDKNQKQEFEAIIDKMCKLEDERWRIHQDILKTYEEVTELRIEIVKNKFDEFLKKTES